MDELLEEFEVEMQQQYMGMEGIDLDGISDSDDSGDSSESDEDEDPRPPPPQYPEAIVDAVLAYLPPMPSASLIAERPLVQLIPCARRAVWTALPHEAIKEIFRHLPISDLLAVGTVLDDAGWYQRWRDVDLTLHDRQIRHGSYKDIGHYIHLHGGVVRSLRVDKIFHSRKSSQLVPAATYARGDGSN
ncbi:hypothetical protein PR202_gb24044 [Eleusine coracana subsp. coracana]|uniref:F-box domain-containing protein n=1 Tax=Eleusine coracana subsp. coracana TaxID=191504 RepID=A0AAV5FLF4_ELECO|nr:hypothetical protein PR202_gb24044 [Eleusine coracana subsp. coracana]